MTITVHPDLSTVSVRADILALCADPRTAQHPFRNGVTVHRKSVWGGNGFGTDVTRVAVRDHTIVAIYESAQTHRIARVVGIGDISSDGAWTGHGTNRRRVVTWTALNKWIDAVRSL
ncbi:MAG: hypothetical protein ACSLEW_08890 [Nocardioides sp.]